MSVFIFCVNVCMIYIPFLDSTKTPPRGNKADKTLSKASEKNSIKNVT